MAGSNTPNPKKQKARDALGSAAGKAKPGTARQVAPAVVDDGSTALAALGLGLLILLAAPTLRLEHWKEDGR
jgi:hypothetical protein